MRENERVDTTEDTQPLLGDRQRLIDKSMAYTTMDGTPDTTHTDTRARTHIYRQTRHTHAYQAMSY